MAEVTACNSGEADVKGIVASLPSLGSMAGGRQLPRCENTQSILWKGPHSKEPRPPANSQEGAIQRWSSGSSQTFSLLQPPACTLRRIPCQNHPAHGPRKPLPELGATETKRLQAFCSNLPSFVANCQTATVN